MFPGAVPGFDAAGRGGRDWTAVPGLKLRPGFASLDRSSLSLLRLTSNTSLSGLRRDCGEPTKARAPMSANEADRGRATESLLFLGCFGVLCVSRLSRRLAILLLSR